MRKSLNLLFVSLCLLLGISASAFAQEGNTPRNINERQHKQQKRIFNGVKDDELNRKEYFRIQREQNQIRREERRYRNSGDKFTRAERLDVRRDLNKSSRHIYRAKHN